MTEQYRARLQIVSDAKTEAESYAKQARNTLFQLDSRKSRYDAKEIAGKVLKVESIGALGC